MKTLTLFTIILFVFFPIQAYSAKSVLDFGAVPDDGNDDSQAITDAVESGEDIYFPDGVYNVSSSIMLNSKSFQDNSLYALNYKGAIIKGNGAAMLKAHYFYQIKNFVFDNIGMLIFGGQERNNTRYFTSNEFINLSQSEPCIVAKGMYGPVGNLHVHHNRFIGGRHTIYGYMKNSTIEHNYSEGCKRNYFLFHSEHVIFRQNEMHGGMTGIAFPCTEGASNVIFGNIIENNQIIDISEEGITFDNFGNRSTSYSRYRGKVIDYESVNGKVTRLYLDTEPAENLSNQSVMFMDDGKAIKGYSTSISGTGAENNQAFLDVRSGPSVDLMYDNAQIAVLAFIPKENKIRYNNVVRSGRSGISLHGAGCYNLIEYNTLIDCNHELPEKHDFWGGISIKNILAKPTPGEYGPVFFNTIRYNMLSGTKCDMTLHFPWGTPFNTIGNEFYENSFKNGALKDLDDHRNEPANFPLPSVNITAPDDYSAFSEGKKISLTAELSEFENADSVILLKNTQKIDVIKSAPYEFSIQDLDSGSHVFQVMAMGAKGDRKVTDHITVLCEVESPVISVNIALNMNNRAMVYPNPVNKNGVVNMILPEELSGRVQVSVHNLQGKLVYTPIKTIKSNRTLKFYLNSKLQKGAYVLSVKNEKHHMVYKLIVY